jgi:hypothetical protein
MQRRQYMMVSHHQNSRQNLNIRIAIDSFENVAKFKYMRTTQTNQNDMMKSGAD